MKRPEDPWAERVIDALRVIWGVVWPSLIVMVATYVFLFLTPPNAHAATVAANDAPIDSYGTGASITGLSIAVTTQTYQIRFWANNTASGTCRLYGPFPTALSTGGTFTATVGLNTVSLPTTAGTVDAIICDTALIGRDTTPELIYELADAGGFDSPGDPSYSSPTDPLTTVYDPPPDRTFAAYLLHDYTFRAAALVRDDVYPDETFIMQWRLKDSLGDVVASSPFAPYLVTDGFLCVRPGVCDAFYPTASFTIPYAFEDGTTYTVEARSRALSGGDWGAWSAPLTLSTENTCATPDGWWTSLLCFFESAGERLVYPSPASLTYLTSAQDDVSASPMGQFIADGLGYTESDEPYCPMPTYEASWFGVSGLGAEPEYDLCDAMEEASSTLTANDRVVDGFLAYVAAVGIGLGLGWLGIIVEGRKLT